MKINECFECGATEDLQQHHVVPRSRGGTKTVTLCTQCHGKAHGRDLKGLEHSRLTKEGIARAKTNGQKLGFDLHSEKIRSKATKKSTQTRAKRAYEHALKWGPVVEAFLNEGHSWNEVCHKLDKLGAPTSASSSVKIKATKWCPAAVARLRARFKKIKNNP